ncbi:MAG: LysR substrate-binding domain-containing protein [Synechococcaceae cyanobacterium]|nr:LysR substrate-binding domain-containing protein [Synechococcaceae cyanobacterium]
MLSLDRLAVLDLTVWLHSGEETGRRLGLTQPNISRGLRRALDLFGLTISLVDQDWHVDGPQESLQLLEMERHLHQHARWDGLAPLRIEGTYWSGPLLLEPEPDGWTGGRHFGVGIQRPLRLLRQRVIDAWLAGGPDWPEPDDPAFAVVPLCRMPLHLVVAPGHPLLGQLHRQGQLSWAEVTAFPSLALPSGAYPKVETALRAIGLWSCPSPMHRYRRDRWEGLSEQELMLAYATVLSEQVAGPLVRLPFTLPVSSGEALVVRRDCAEHPRLLQLAALLRRRLEPWAQRFPELEICP